MRPAWAKSMRCSLGFAVALMAVCVAPVSRAFADDEPTAEDCRVAMDRARTHADALPADDGSRYFAQRYLAQAAAEAANGEFDDCVDLATEALAEVKAHRHPVTVHELFAEPPKPTP